MSDFIYQKLSSEIIQAINSGILHEGEKLDSVRKLASKREIGVSTATHVYRELEKCGWIYSIEKKGYFVASQNTKNTESNKQSYGNYFLSPEELSELPLANAVQFSFNDPKILPLSCTAPSTVVDAEVILNQMHRKALKRRPYRMLMQDPVEGLTALRIEISKHYLRSGQVVEYNDILITNGRKDSFFVVLQALKLKKSCIAIEAPSSYFFQSMLQEHDIKTVAVPMQSDFSVELELLDKAYQAEAFSAYLFNPNFNDPTGRVLSKQEKLQLIAWAEKNEVALIEYDRGELSFSGQRPPSVTSLLMTDSTCKVISIVDFYDTISATISLGYIICRNTYKECLFAKQVNIEESSISLQYMILEMLQSAKYNKFVDKVRSQLAYQCRQTSIILSEYLGGKVIINKPSGGPCLWLKLPKYISSRELWHYLIKFNIAIAPGCMFITSAQFDNYFRVTFGLPWDEKMQLGITNMAKHINDFLQSKKI
ncbi:PLP-dependent aminotransferase family protein [Pseudoalteromonas denitrificans]|uniref:DNA-binding transcriptional regulator, MocR family, contains an aminotransferase domain n=1 Tax=Pseudoalteromonas denitrificans DSM 6059 TaxID=1123010 RepID=A0A1I1S0E4_9GAMM|nr:PLP-dependent aminotransferase family protein [Pseudoalteromonas denitrificans]SFD40044.1 DNA-binding transcriptional regulator, MocR family, contains an aminotransferase domain [Pseudoalteromonas denitrificans DSM 6059]